MGFFNKIKDILFDEVDEEETNNKKEIKKEVKEEKIAEKIEPQRVVEPKEVARPVARPVAVDAPKKVENVKPNYNEINDRDLYRSENTFSFPDFDEEEFDTSISRRERPTTTNNVLEYEHKRKVERKYDYGRFERTETKEVVEKKKFKPSPIISPVYGILNEDYKIEDIKDKTEENREANLDFNSVRKKAFPETIEKLDEPVKEKYYEETVTIKMKGDNELEKQGRTIDELLEDSADATINTMEITEEIPLPVTKEVSEEAISDYENIDNELDELIQSNTKPEINEEKKEDNMEDDTLESDLFDLIDSMYDAREDGE